MLLQLGKTVMSFVLLHGLCLFYAFGRRGIVECNNEGVGQRVSGMFGSVLRGQGGTQLGHVSGHHGRLSQA